MPKTPVKFKNGLAPSVVVKSTHFVWAYLFFSFISTVLNANYTPTTKCGGGYTGFALSRRSVRRSVGPSVSNSCPLYNSFTNGRIAFKLE